MRPEQFRRAGIAACCFDAIGFPAHLLGQAVNFDQQERRGIRRRQPRLDVARHRLERVAIDQLKRGGNDACTQQPHHRVDGVLDGGKRGAQGRRDRRLRDQAQHDLRDDRQRAFGSDRAAA